MTDPIPHPMPKSAPGPAARPPAARPNARHARLALGAFLLLMFGTAALEAQHTGHEDPATAADQAAADATPEITGLPLYENLGTLARPISTSSAQAQAYFDQGLRLTYGFGHGEAVRSFREARAHDPACASCAWGEAWAMGPNINGRMRADAIPGAHAAVSRALEIVEAGTPEVSPVEEALIRALATRYAPTADAEREAGGRAALDSAYARAMDEVAQRFPDDLEVLTLAGEAHMVLRPWSYWAADGSPEPGVERSLEVLERALGLDLAHPGSCHLYIHLVEASPAPERAAPCAELLEDGIPGVSHIPHMPSHIFMRIGRYGDAVRGNQRAWVADQRANYDGAPGVYTSHNLHMLAFAASMDGQGAVAIRAAHDLAGIAAGSSFYVPLTLVRFGKWEEILALPMVEDNDFRAGVHHFARGLARLRGGDPLRAGVEFSTLEALRARLPGNARFRGHLQRDLLGMAAGILEGEILAAEGEVDAAVAALEAAVAIEAGLSYDEPEPWTIPVRHFLGAVLLEAERPAEAEGVFRASLEVHPDNGWALVGLAQALRAQGRAAEAAEADEAFRQAWVRSDHWIAASRF